MLRASQSRSWLASIAVLAVVLAPDCAPSRPPDVVLVVLDTVRADHLSAYGYARPTSPHLEAFARGADRHTAARATAPWTLPSHASLFTGLLPFEHGAEARKDPRTGAFIDAPSLREELVTLAEALASEGYETRGIVANPIYLDRRSGLSQGFESWEVLPLGGNDWRHVTHRAFERLRDRAPARPLFLFLNFMDAHRPYHVVPPPDRLGLPAPDPAEPGALLDELAEQVLERGAADPSLVTRVTTHYDTGIANADRGIGALLARLAAQANLDNALVIVTSDHGEYLGEHGLVEHSKDVYEPALWVPLVVKQPGQRRGRVLDSPLSLADIPRLVAAALPPAQATRLARAFPPPEDTAPMAELRYTRPKDLFGPHGARFDRIRTVLYQGDWKLSRSSDGAHELYDLRADPAEARNRIGDEPLRASQMLGEIDRRVRQREFTGRWPDSQPPTPEEQEALRALGYLGAKAE